MDSWLRNAYHKTRQLPVLRPMFERAYKRRFAHDRIDFNAYCGVYPDFATALANAPTTMPIGYDHDVGATMYLSRTRYVLACDYPAMFWLERLLAEGCRTVFDFGGNIGIKYYAYQRYLRFPNDLRWMVCELPKVVATGSAWAKDHDPSGQIGFTENQADLSGQDVLFASGVLQYLDDTLWNLLDRLDRPPRHILVNVLPLHANLSFFTIQNSALLYSVYRIMAHAEFVSALAERGYRIRDQWDQLDRQCIIPFHPENTVEKYHGFLFSRTDERS